MLSVDSSLLLRLDALNPDYYFDIRSKRYRYRDSKRFAPKRAMLSLTQKYRDISRNHLTQLAYDYYQGVIDLQQLQRQSAQLLKQIHLSEAILAADGVENMTSDRFLIVARQLKTQYYSGKDKLTGNSFGLKYLFHDLQSSKVSEAQLANRLRKFGLSSKITFWDIKRDVATKKGYTEARRILGKSEHCKDCPVYASRGWGSLSKLVLPATLCECGTECKCSVEFR